MTSISRDTSTLGVITWSLLANETAKDDSLGRLLRCLENEGCLDSHNPALGNLSTISDSVYAHDGVLLYNDRVIVPTSLRETILTHLHAAHQGISTMEQRARTIVYWPGMSKDIQDTRNRCSDCNRNAPSQASTLPLPSSPPSTPFEEIFADFFDHGGCHYLVVGDRLSGWVEVLRSTANTNLGGSAGLVRHLRTLFATFGVPEEISSDGGPEFTASNTQSFLKTWGVRHRVSSVSFPQSNGRAEVAVKAAKRLLMSNTGPTGNLNQDNFLRAILHLRNTPDRDCALSPAQVIFGRPLRDSLSFVNCLEKYSNPNIRPLWRQAWEAKEDALRTRISRTTEALQVHSRPLRPLSIGERVFLQNQIGHNPNKWDRSGIVVEALAHDQYRVKVDGSGRLTLRNRRFLRAYTPVSTLLSKQEHKNTVPLPPTTRDLQQPITKNTMVQIRPDPTSTDYDASECPPGQDPPNVEAPAPREQQHKQDMVPAPQIDRPQRKRRPPKRYEPETGRWIEQ